MALFISAIIGVAYGLYLVSYFGGIIGNTSSGAEAVGGALATAMVTPHMVCVVVAAIFNVLAWLNNTRGFALVAAILYCVAAVLFLLYAMFLIPSIVLSFIGFSRLKKINAENTAVTV